MENPWFRLWVASLRLTASLLLVLGQHHGALDDAVAFVTTHYERCLLAMQRCVQGAFWGLLSYFVRD